MDVAQVRLSSLQRDVDLLLLQPLVDLLFFQHGALVFDRSRQCLLERVDLLAKCRSLFLWQILHGFHQILDRSLLSQIEDAQFLQIRQALTGFQTAEGFLLDVCYIFHTHFLSCKKKAQVQERTNVRGTILLHLATHLDSHDNRMNRERIALTPRRIQQLPSKMPCSR